MKISGFVIMLDLLSMSASLIHRIAFYETAITCRATKSCIALLVKLPSCGWVETNGKVVSHFSTGAGASGTPLHPTVQLPTASATPPKRRVGDTADSIDV